ncbi:pyruvate kinase [Asticcacaulis machinosus]|uniref:Pyruvate kinase n=1 Tax=Asticcacaulis machinosus TaxID=2984211 RepID=A0ABT5HI46_9CAUL|nr:pyruvate kinase [Asticcacaulis machinosus]MDC7675921.1 pyruvate kinase [Asticcacaulis machinosus]
MKILRRRRTKIVATLGPASSNAEMLQQLFQAGADVFRLNFSHGSHEDHGRNIDLIRDLEARTKHPIGILADVQGPKLRVGRFMGGAVVLNNGQTFRLDLNPTPGDSRRANLPHPEIIAAAQIGSHLLLDDGKLKLKVVHVREDHLETVVINGGRLSDRKGVNVPDVVLPIPALTKKDREDMAFALERGVEYIGLSFVQRPEDVLEAKEIIKGRAWVLSKLEKPQALDNLEEIMALSDAVMVARGDLGVELPPEEVPLAQKRIIQSARMMGKPVVVATQMLESMISAPTPTRAEASDVATAVFDGSDAVMLSAETAAGQFPIEAVTIMDRIIARVETDEGWRANTDRRRPEPEKTTSGAMAAAARQVAQTIDASAIAALTNSASTALRVARERPNVPILGLTPNIETARRLAITWGVHAIEAPVTHSMSETVAVATQLARSEGISEVGENIVIVAGMPFGKSGSTNALRVAKVTRTHAPEPEFVADPKS